MKTFRIAATLAAGLLAFNAHAGLFEDDEARRAILDLRQKVDAAQTRTAEELRRTTEDNAQLRRSLLDLSNQIEVLRNELANMRSSALTRLCACLALLALALKRAMNFCRWAIFSCCLANAVCCSAICSERRSSNLL